MYAALLLTLAFAVDGSSSPPPEETGPSASAIDAQVAWARLYGLLRWFHPSDELSSVDPERLACLGAQRVAEAEDPESLARTLTELADPLAPTVQIWVDGTSAPDPVVVEDAPERTPIAWMHRGVGLESSPLYRSGRTGRTQRVPAPGASFGNLTQDLPGEPLAGRRFRYTSRVRALEGQVQPWIRTDGGEDRFFDNSDRRPVRGTSWQDVVIEGEIPAGTERVVFGAFVPGLGHGEVASITLEVLRDDAWVPAPVANPTFEDGTAGWSGEGKGYEFSGSDGIACIERKTVEVAPPFEAVPEPGSFTEVALGGGVRARVPLVLFSEQGHTLPPGDASALDDAMDAVPCTRHDDVTTRLAAVAIAWNIHQHFHPYLDVVGVDWMAELPKAARGAIEADDANAFREVLERMTATLQDGHVFVRGGAAPTGRLPLHLDVLGDDIVVRASSVEGVAPGDIVQAVNGRDAWDLHASWVPLVSGSPQYVALRALAAVTTGERGDTAVVDLVGADGSVRQQEVAYGSSWEPPSDTPAIRTLDDGVMVVDLTRAVWAELRPLRRAMRRAPGVVFDLRGYPTDAGSKLLPYVIREPDDRDWMFVAERTRPDQAEPVSWRGASWNLKPRGPHIDNTVWITDARAISYAESVLGHVKDLDIGPIVGEATAGANGNVNPYRLPGNYQISWTGMKVLDRDGRQHHVVGVTPTHPVEPTPEGLRAGRDEQLERALKLVRAAAD